MLAHAKHVVDPGQDGGEDRFAVAVAFYGSGTVLDDRGHRFLALRSLLATDRVHAVDGRHAGGGPVTAFSKSGVDGCLQKIETRLAGRAWVCRVPRGSPIQGA